ncbi:MAG: zinc-dependent peptidase, partial [Maritimibacter sp.]|nr:zinc-dependent peptidase [Maritimibacter sp.]
HQIDALTGRANGVPPFAPGQDFAAWERAFLTAYETHLANLRAGRPTVFDPYGATAHAEFFAVAVELFFERPTALRDDAPEVYRQLSILFALDPAGWPG